METLLDEGMVQRDKHEPGFAKTARQLVHEVGRVCPRRAASTGPPLRRGVLRTAAPYQLRRPIPLCDRRDAKAPEDWRSPRPGGSARAGFSLIELLVVIAVVGLLAAILLPTLTRSRALARAAECSNNLRQLSLATHMYWDDNSGASFRWEWGATNGGRLYWFGWLQDGAEGQRAFDPRPGVLYPYLHEHSVGICPALNYYLAQFKLKATGAAYGYGYNLFLSAQPSQSPWKVFALRTSQVGLFADAAQINDFQAPASKTNPMLEEWYYIDTTSNYPNGHFRHNQKANTAFCDGHVGPEQMVPGSLDPRLPQQFVGRLRDEILLVH